MERDKALDMALGQIEKQFGKGSIMRMGENLHMNIEAIPTGALALDLALGIGGLPRGRIVEIFGPESSGKSTLAMHVVAEAQRNGGICAYVDAEHAMDPVYAKAIGVNIDDLLISQPDTGEQALEIADMLIRSGALDVLVIDSVAALTPTGGDRRGDGGHPRRAPGPSDVPGAAQAHRHAVEVPDHRHLHQPAAREDRGHVRLPRGHPGRPGPQVLLVRPAWTSAGSRPSRTAPTRSGNRTRVKVVKNKCSPPFKQAEFDITFGRGISREGSLLDVGVELGLHQEVGRLVHL